MPTLETLQHAITSTHDLQSVVRTMKALAAVSIHQYERAVGALAEYTQTIELGIQIVLRNQPRAMEVASTRPGAPLGAIVFGSDYGMVGQFNEQVATYAADVIRARRVEPANCRIIAVGERVAARLEDAGATVEQTFGVPGSVAGITTLVQDVLVHIEAWREQQVGDRLVLVYNQTGTGALYQPTHLDLLPLEQQWLRDLATRPWRSRRLPTFTLGWEELFAALLRQYLFVALYRACAESLASENASRLAAMQRAEHHIDERLDELTRAFHQQRQSAITAELLDIVAGVEALTEAAQHRPGPHKQGKATPSRGCPGNS
jgi:F-type H+-transporting ATPase subunit gamma